MAFLLKAGCCALYLCHEICGFCVHEAYMEIDKRASSTRMCASLRHHFQASQEKTSSAARWRAVFADHAPPSSASTMASIAGIFVQIFLHGNRNGDMRRWRQRAARNISALPRRVAGDGHRRACRPPTRVCSMWGGICRARCHHRRPRRVAERRREAQQPDLIGRLGRRCWRAEEGSPPCVSARLWPKSASCRRRPAGRAAAATRRRLSAAAYRVKPNIGGPSAFILRNCARAYGGEARASVKK